MSEGIERERTLIFEQRRNKRKRNRLISFTIILVFFFSIVGSYAWKAITQSFLQIEFVQSGSVERLIPIEGLVIRDEVLVNATENGSINKIVPEGEKVRINSHIANLSTNNIDSTEGGASGKLRAPIPGLVSYKIDGFEEILTPKIINDLDLEKVNKLTDSEGSSLNNKGKINQGENGVKIINNLGYTYILAEINKEKIDKSILEDSKTLRLQYQDQNKEDKSFRLRIKRIKETNDSFLILLETPYYQHIFNNRRITLDLLVNSYKGIKVSDNAIVYKNNKPGLYVVVRSIVKWVPVEIVGKNEDMTVVENKKALTVDSQYIANPELTSEGSNVD